MHVSKNKAAAEASMQVKGEGPMQVSKKSSW